MILKKKDDSELINLYIRYLKQIYCKNDQPALAAFLCLELGKCLQVW